MNPHLKASLETAAVAFAAGFLKSLEPYISTGTVPPQAQWGGILVTAAGAGIAFAWAKWSASPAEQAKQVKT